jgi:hypothetical protein
MRQWRTPDIFLIHEIRSAARSSYRDEEGRCIRLPRAVGYAREMQQAFLTVDTQPPPGEDRAMNRPSHLITLISIAIASMVG